MDQSRAADEGGVPWRERRGFVVFALLALGFAVAESGLLGRALPWGGLGCAAACAVAATLLRGWACRVTLMVSVVALGAAWFSWRCDRLPADTLRLPWDSESVMIEVEALARERPEIVAQRADPYSEPGRAGAPWRFEASVVRAVRGDASVVPVSGLLTVSCEIEPVGVAAGDTVRLRGFARGVTSAMNPGEPDRARIARQDGRAGSMRIPEQGVCEKVDRAGGSAGGVVEWAQGAWLALRQRVRDAASSALGVGDTADRESDALLRLMLLGERESHADDLFGAFARAGLAHVLSVSGVNLTILAACTVGLLRLLTDRPRIEGALLSVVVLVFLLVTPAEAPIVRAGLMVLVYCAAELAGRRYDRLNTLALAACVTILYRPMDLWAPGFQLSYLGVGALIWLTRPLRTRLFGSALGVEETGAGLRGLLLRAFEWFKTFVAAALCAWAISTPVVLWHTGTVSPVGPLANVVAAPLVAVISAAGYAGLIVGAAAPSVGGLILDAVRVPGEWLITTARAMESLPGGVLYLGWVSAAWCAGMTAWTVWWILRGWSRRCGLALAGLAVWFGVETWAWPANSAPRLEAAAIRLTGGGATVVRSGGEAILIDCGGDWAGAGRVTIPRAARRLGAARVQTVVLTRPDGACFNALPHLVRPLGVREVVVTPWFTRRAADTPDGPAASLLALLKAEGVRLREVTAGDSWALGDAEVRVLHPPPDARPSTHRDAATVLDVRARGTPGVVVLGDLSESAWRELERGPPPGETMCVVAPRARWGAERFDRIAGWCGLIDAGVVVRHDAEPAENPRVRSTRDGGCVRVGIDRAGGVRVDAPR